MSAPYRLHPRYRRCHGPNPRSVLCLQFGQSPGRCGCRYRHLGRWRPVQLRCQAGWQGLHRLRSRRGPMGWSSFGQSGSAKAGLRLRRACRPRHHLRQGRLGPRRCRGRTVRSGRRERLGQVLRCWSARRRPNHRPPSSRYRRCRSPKWTVLRPRNIRVEVPGQRPNDRRCRHRRLRRLEYRRCRCQRRKCWGSEGLAT